MAVSSPFLPGDEPEASFSTDSPATPFPEPVKLFEAAMADIPRASLLGPTTGTTSSGMAILGEQATRAATAVIPTNGPGALIPRVTPAVVDRLIQETLGKREQDFGAKQAERQRTANVDMMIVDQMQHQLTGESTRYAPLREVL